MTTKDSGVLQWSEIDKVTFFGTGTIAYSILTAGLHPVSVLKTRQQVLSSTTSKDSKLHQPTLKATYLDVIHSKKGFRGLFRGAGIVVSVAVPARILYIGVLENSRQDIGHVMNRAILQTYAGPEEAHNLLPLIASISGGLAGGLAAVSAQVLAVPMDVISQRQMVMSHEQYAREGTVKQIVKSIIRADGWKGLYRGFGLSVFNSLPAGTIWWATYSGCQVWIQPHLKKIGSGDTAFGSMLQKGVTQVFAGLSAATVASCATQPLDVVKTRVQVGEKSYMAVAKELMATSGIRGFFRGLGPRIGHIALWGTCLSSAYELLRHISRIDKSKI